MCHVQCTLSASLGPSIMSSLLCLLVLTTVSCPFYFVCPPVLTFVCHQLFSCLWGNSHYRCCVLNSLVSTVTDEMYQLFSYLPEDIQYRCRVCSPTDPPEWQTILREELLSGLRSVLTGLLSFKCSHHLLVIDKAVSSQRWLS